MFSCLELNTHSQAIASLVLDKLFNPYLANVENRVSS